MDGRMVQVGAPDLSERNGVLTLTAEVGVNGRRHTVWYRVPRGPIDCSVYPFLAASLIPAMRVRAALHVAQPVSRKLLQALSEFQRIFHGWFPEFIPVDVRAAPRQDAAAPPADGVGTFFTGGVDSFYSLVCHRAEITTLIFVHGFDIPLAHTAFRRKVSDSLRKAADRMKLPLIEVETNLRDFSDVYAEWGPHYHGAGLASVALLLSPQLKRLYIPASNSYPDYSAWGSHPYTDPLWSTEQTEIVYDGFETSRFQKVQLLAECDVAMQYLRVCHENRGGAYNCGRCEKCLRTMVSLRIVDALERCRTFSCGLSLWRVARMILYNDWTRLFVEENLKELERRGGDPVLERALRDCLNGRYNRGLWRVSRNLWQILRYRRW